VTGKVGVLVEVACETDFVARTGRVPAALARPRDAHRGARSDAARVTREEIDSAAATAERGIVLAQVIALGKPQNIAEKIVEGKMDKWYADRIADGAAPSSRTRIRRSRTS